MKAGKPPNHARSPGPAAPATVPHSSPPMWLLRSRHRALACALGGGALVFCGAFFTQRYLKHQGIPTLPMIAASDALVGLLAAALIVRVAWDAIERREATMERLRAIGDINHHIRNGLATLQLSAYATEDKRALAALRDSMDRIEWTLREILGPSGPLADTLLWRKDQEARHGPERSPD